MMPLTFEPADSGTGNLRSRRTLSSMLVAGMLAIGACGNSQSSDDADARAAVADFVEAAGKRDSEAMCGKLTAAAARQAAALVTAATGETGGCEVVFDRQLNAAPQRGSFAALTGAADQIRAGDVPVAVAIDRGHGTVVIPADSKSVPIPVEQSGAEWLIVNARGLLFGTWHLNRQPES
jgi:hypothetical protein